MSIVEESILETPKVWWASSLSLTLGNQIKSLLNLDIHILPEAHCVTRRVPNESMSHLNFAWVLQDTPFSVAAAIPTDRIQLGQPLERADTS